MSVSGSLIQIRMSNQITNSIYTVHSVVALSMCLMSGGLDSLQAPVTFIIQYTRLYYHCYRYCSSRGMKHVLSTRPWLLGEMWYDCTLPSGSYFTAIHSNVWQEHNTVWSSSCTVVYFQSAYNTFNTYISFDCFT